ncbi:LysR family transcriptional regulator [Inconstantimicrobium mannanitabidum]|uniref:LysR family transcriptional regulator n=1 Tax=Inconstantimicrobium mannanitabidum TaxID=1604901 RepID=A0ACB5RDB2_9CLOT|nr:LysR family transcriptional regulator [Clostridium sp. TW13]GKX67260.1 LysR family transcriptional regulator [Clostridium sp. TW13]
MDIKQLKYFLTIADEEQITSAAKKLHISQPPLSYQLKNLEEELGVKLLERGSRKIHLTPAGRILRNRAEQIIQLTDATSREIMDLKNGFQGTLALGTVSSSGYTLLDTRLKVFHKTYPHINFELYEGNTYKIIEYLNCGLIEVGIVRTPFNMSNFDYITAEEEPMIAVMREELDAFKNIDTISIEDLKEKPLIIYKRFESLIKERCNAHGFEPLFFCKNEDARTTLSWADAGLGIGIMPKSAFNSMNNSDLKYKIIDDPLLNTQIAAIYLKDKYISTSAQHFLEVFENSKKYC